MVGRLIELVDHYSFRAIQFDHRYFFLRSIELPKSTEIPESTEILESIELPKSTNSEEYVTQHKSESNVNGPRLISIVNFTTKEHLYIIPYYKYSLGLVYV